MAKRTGLGRGLGFNGMITNYYGEDQETGAKKSDTATKNKSVSSKNKNTKTSGRSSGAENGEEEREVKSKSGRTSSVKGTSRKTSAGTKKAGKVKRTVEAEHESETPGASIAEEEISVSEELSAAGLKDPMRDGKMPEAGESEAWTSDSSMSKSGTSENKNEDIANGEKTVSVLKISEIEPGENQPRKTFDRDSLEQLAESIKQYGIIQPIVVKKKGDHYEIIAGERRWRAARMAGLREVPVIIQDFSDQEVMEISLIENIQRENLNPIEEAEAFERLLNEFEMTQDELAARVSKSRTAITNSIRLLKLSPDVRQMLAEGKITSGHARALLAVEDPALQLQLAQKTADEQLSVREVEKLVKDLQKPKRESKKEFHEDEALSLIYKDMEDHMKEALGTRVTVNRKDHNRGRIEIEYYSGEELERIYDLLRKLG